MMSCGTPLGVVKPPRGEPAHPKTFRKGEGMKRWIVFLTGLLLFGCASIEMCEYSTKRLDKLYSQVNALRKENALTKSDLLT